MPEWNPWICVNCKSTIDSPSGCQAKTIICPSCRLAFPLIAPETPILVREPEQAITDSYFSLLRQMRAMRARSRAFEQESSQQRSAAVTLVREGLAHNLELVTALQRELLSSLPTDRRAEVERRAASQQERSFTSRALRTISRLRRGASAEMSAREARTSIGYMLEILEYVRRDWGGSPLAEQRIACVEKSVFALVGNHAADKSCALVLGAGMARFAWDLRQMFDHVVAAEASLMAAVLHHRLREADVTFYEINEQSAYTPADQASTVVASVSKRIPHAADDPGDLVFCVADARNIPLADRSVSVVLSIYFTDVLPLSVLLPEVKRLLAKGGIFVHFGPLDYHFADFKEKYTVEEVRGIFQKEGFEIRSESWVEDIWRTEATMRGHFTNAWCFCAVYTG